MNKRDVLIMVVVVALLVTVVGIAAYTQGIQAGWATAEAEVVVETVEVPVKETIEVPVIQTVEVPQIVEKPCVVTCPCVEPPCVEPCKPCEVPEVPTVMPKPTPTPKEAVCPSEFGDHELQRLETWQVPACWTCLGDLVVEGIQYYDEGVAETGLVIYFAESAEVYAEWGANCISGDRRTEKKAEALESGCGLPKGCEEVHVYVWPGDPPN